MAASDDEIAKMLELLARDFACTRPARHLDALPSSVGEVREWYESMSDSEIASLTRRVVDDTQQDLMDTFIDTTWPTCPRHPNHPLWFHDGAWYCERDDEALAKLGGLREILPPLPPEPPFVPGPFVRRPRKG
jgi:hypothetical protein